MQYLTNASKYKQFPGCNEETAALSDEVEQG
jgi:hypothetical protein